MNRKTDSRLRRWSNGVSFCPEASAQCTSDRRRAYTRTDGRTDHATATSVAIAVVADVCGVPPKTRHYGLSLWQTARHDASSVTSFRRCLHVQRKPERNYNSDAILFPTSSRHRQNCTEQNRMRDSVQFRLSFTCSHRLTSVRSRGVMTSREEFAVRWSRDSSWSRDNFQLHHSHCLYFDRYLTGWLRALAHMRRDWIRIIKQRTAAVPVK